MQCDTANGNSNVFSYLKAHRNEKILVIADGAAFGPEMDRVLQLVQTRENLVLYLPQIIEYGRREDYFFNERGGIDPTKQQQGHS